MSAQSQRRASGAIGDGFDFEGLMAKVSALEQTVPGVGSPMASEGSRTTRGHTRGPRGRHRPGLEKSLAKYSGGKARADHSWEAIPSPSSSPKKKTTARKKKKKKKKKKNAETGEQKEQKGRFQTASLRLPTSPRRRAMTTEGRK